MRWYLNSGVILIFAEDLLDVAVDEERQQQPVDCSYADNDTNHQLYFYVIKSCE